MATRGASDRHDVVCDVDNLNKKRSQAAAKLKMIVATVDHKEQQQWMNTKTQGSEQQIKRRQTIQDHQLGG
jgi:hypothetical protein